LGIQLGRESQWRRNPLVKTGFSSPFLPLTVSNQNVWRICIFVLHFALWAFVTASLHHPPPIGPNLKVNPPLSLCVKYAPPKVAPYKMSLQTIVNFKSA
jgi:hypothetical protein